MMKEVVRTICDRCKKEIDNEDYIYDKETDSIFCWNCMDYLESCYNSIDDFSAEILK